MGDEAVEGESSKIAGLGQVENVDAAVDLPCVEKGEDQQKLIEETKEDCTLAICRALADKKERGYFCERGYFLFWPPASPGRCWRLLRHCVIH